MAKNLKTQKSDPKTDSKVIQKVAHKISHKIPRLQKNLRPQNLKLALRAGSGLAVGSIYPLSLNRNVLGRSVEAVIPVDDSKVSRSHATVDIQNGFHYLVDLGSINGTFLNGNKIDRAMMISVGDEVRVGSTVFHVDLLDQAKNHIAKSWREPTRAIVIQRNIQVPQAIALATAQPEATGARWRNLLEPVWVNRFQLTEINRKWISIGICLLLVVAAIATTFGKSSV